MFLNSDGKLIKSYNYKGYSINSINYFEEKLFLTSNRLNKHYILNKEGEMQVYSNANEQRNNKYLASWFTRSGEKTLIETINIGSVNSKYLSSIIYSYEGEKKHCLLENQYLNNAADKFNKIFVESYSENDQKNGITIIDKDSGKIEKRVNFKNAFTSSGRQLIDHNNNLVTYGNNDLNNFPQKEAQSAIGVLNCKTYETTEYLFENEKIIFSYIHNNNIYYHGQ